VINGTGVCKAFWENEKYRKNPLSPSVAYLKILYRSPSIASQAAFRVDYGWFIWQASLWACEDLAMRVVASSGKCCPGRRVNPSMDRTLLSLGDFWLGFRFDSSRSVLIERQSQTRPHKSSRQSVCRSVFLSSWELFTQPQCPAVNHLRSFGA